MLATITLHYLHYNTISKTLHELHHKMRSLVGEMKMEILRFALKFLFKTFTSHREHFYHMYEYICIIMKERVNQIVLGELTWKYMLGEK